MIVFRKKINNAIVDCIKYEYNIFTYSYVIIDIQSINTLYYIGDVLKIKKEDFIEQYYCDDLDIAIILYNNVFAVGDDINLNEREEFSKILERYNIIINKIQTEFGVSITPINRNMFSRSKNFVEYFRKNKIKTIINSLKS